MDLVPSSLEDYLFQSFSVLKPKQYIGGNCNAIGYLEDTKKLNKDIK